MTKATFLKYPSIENHFHTSDLQKWVDRYPEVQYLPWEVTEKIDGANVQLLFLGDGTYMIGRREAWLTPGEKFFDIWNTLAREPKLVDILTTYAGSNNKPIRVYCELFSDSINKRVRYGKTQSLRILDISLENDGQEQFLNKIQLKAFLGRLDLREFYVPVVGIYSSFKEALEVSEFFDSLILKEKNNPAEGLVMCPMKIPEFPGVYPTPENQLRFMIKKKSAAFLETKPKKIKTIVERSEQENKFLSYITENRLLSCFTKEGPIESYHDMGKYIKLIMDDAIIDYKKDNPDENPIIKRSGNIIAGMLRQFIAKNGAQNA